jgi:AraC family transcriptional regulator, alkane utilization regulator
LGKRGLAQIAQDVGYDSEAAFNRAFKRAFGVPPATWRRTRGGISRDPSLAPAR